MIDGAVWRGLPEFAFNHEISTSDIIKHLAKKFLTVTKQAQNDRDYRELVYETFAKALKK